jgi:hypothetical protein
VLRRTACLLVALVLLAGACSGDDDEDAASTTSTPGTTADGTVITTGTTQTTAASGSTSTDTTEPIPPVTPPANQPEACAVLSQAADVDASDVEVFDQPNGQPAPSTGCRVTASGVALSLFYGQDPLETLAVARVQEPVGSDVTGLGQDAWEAGGVLYVDTGSRAFAVTGGGRDELIALAQRVIENL